MLKRTVYVLSAAGLLLLSIPAKAEDDPDVVAKRLVPYIIITSVAMACGEPASLGNKISDLIWQKLNAQQPKVATRITKSRLEKLIFDRVERDEHVLKESHGKYFGRPCSYYRSMAHGMVESKGEVISFVDADPPSSKAQAQQEQEQEQELSKEALKKQLEDLSAKYPKGALKTVVGCWSTTTPSWVLQTCFTDGGDSVNVKITSKKGTTCHLTNGTARKRSDAIFFYAFAEPPVCTDNSSIEHVEALCEPGDREMNCLFSFFSHSNYMFSLRNQESAEDINGQLKLMKN